MKSPRLSATSVPYFTWTAGAPLLVADESSMSSWIRVPLCMTSGIMANSTTSLESLPSASIIVSMSVDLHLLPPRSRRYLAGSSTAWSIALLSYS